MVVFFVFFFGRNDVDLGRKGTHKPVSPLMGSEAHCCGVGPSGISVLIIHFLV